MKSPREGGLHICPQCRSGLVQPVRWEQTSHPERWRLWRRCPECHWQSNGVHDMREVDAFDDVLELGGEALRKELEQFEREGIGEIVDVFSAALKADLITADDFRL